MQPALPVSSTAQFLAQLKGLSVDISSFEFFIYFVWMRDVATEIEVD